MYLKAGDREWWAVAIFESSCEIGCSFVGVGPAQNFSWKQLVKDFSGDYKCPLVYVGHGSGGLIKTDHGSVRAGHFSFE
jgi:hypothetical protein